MNLTQPYRSYESKSKQLKSESFRSPDIIIAASHDLKNITPEEYISFLENIGDQMKEINTGRLVGDFSRLKNTSISISATAVNHLPRAVIAKAPYLVFAVVKSQSAFDNLSVQVALNSAKALSRKIVDGRMFDTLDETLVWITDYKVVLKYANSPLAGWRSSSRGTVLAKSNLHQIFKNSDNH